MRVKIAGVAPPDRLQARKVVGVRVRSLQTGTIVYASGTEAHGIELPAGPFELDVELEMNVAPGVYAIESSVWQWQREADARIGQSTPSLKPIRRRARRSSEWSRPPARR